MSIPVDYTVSKVSEIESSGDSLTSPSVESSPECSGQNDLETTESLFDGQDSGVALNFSSGYKKSLNKPASGGSSRATGIHQATGLNFNLKSSRPNGYVSQSSYQGTPLDLRRASIDYMVNTGGLFINQGGTCEINLDNVNATDVEQLYADAKGIHAQQRKTSLSLSAGQGGGQSRLDEISLSQKLSMGESCEHISVVSKSNKASRHWWSPKFNSVVLERQLKKTVIEFLRRRFRVALVFIGIFALIWIVVFSVNIPYTPFINLSEVDVFNNELAVYSVRYSYWYNLGGGFLIVCIAVLLLSTFTSLYSRYALILSLFFAVILMICSFALALTFHFNKFEQGFLTMSFVAQFAITAIFILTVFTLSRLPIWLSVVLSIIYLIVLECLVGVFMIDSLDKTSAISVQTYYSSGIARILLYISLILSGVTTAYLSKVRQVATFWKIAQCVLSHKALDLERELEEKTILSMMPKHFADGLLNLHVQMLFMLKQRVVQENEGSLDPVYQSISAPFNICSMENVTILFADIVNFTSFSSSLSAEELVGILNNVFSMFDELVTKHKCEKISTLGDCYFCVSGCPEPESAHADNCVNMGLAIIKALEDFRKRTSRHIEMRVGIHTGSVFCGVMGTKRFKFDVWSRDVRIANQIESVGTPGQVLISGSTYSCLAGSYMFEHTNISTTEPEMLDVDLFYVTGQRARTQASGISDMEWKKRINTIDTVHKSENETQHSANRKASVTSIRDSVCPCFRKKTSSPPLRRPLAEGHSASSIVDIQTQLQRCTSYAEIAVPQADEQKNNVDIDEDIVKYMEDHKVHFESYFDPQLHMITLNFHDRDWESTYRKYGRDLDDGLNSELTEMELGYRITKLSYMLDTVALFISFLLIVVGSAVCLSSDGTLDEIWTPWLGIVMFGLLVKVTVLVFVFAVFSPHRFPSCFAKFSTKIINWYVRSLVALFFIYYPMTIACISMTHCQPYTSNTSELAGLAHVQLTFFITIVILVSSITFMEVSHIVKFVGGFLIGSFAVIMVVVVRLSLCTEKLKEAIQNAPITPPPTLSPHLKPITYPTREIPTGAIDLYLSTYYTRHIAPEAIILLVLILILLTLVNRMSEVSVRLSFIARIEASARRRLTRQRKVQAEWLLFNIIPPTVAYKLRTTGKYSQNHDCVGVLFASIVNFRHLLQHDENKGEDSLRLLNCIISEFDMLLEKQQFTSIEKIKTIGSTYMAASGLNVRNEDSDGVEHLLDLINFGHQLVQVLQVMNETVNGFIFEMHIGFNYGPVTSGVVGSRKMLYDIWGDTVNVASRMASTGTVNKIHIPKACLEMLGPYVSHTVHKVVNVKGKGEMSTVFINPPQPPPNHSSQEARPNISNHYVKLNK